MWKTLTPGDNMSWGRKYYITVIIMGEKRNKLRPVKVISLVCGVDHPFQQYFSHIVAVSFIG